jgi:hypothetical protein
MAHLVCCWDELFKETQDLAEHLFIASWQRHQFMSLSNNVPDSWVVMLADFAENFRCKLQDEIQSAHWSYQQATVHPIVAYYRCPEENCREIVQESLVFISPDIRHDASAVQRFFQLANDHLRQPIAISHEVQFTDGCGAQYKSRQPFADVTYSKEDYGFWAERAYFGSKHGKGPCDGLGAVVKQSTKLAVVARDVVVQNAEEMFKYLHKNMTISRTTTGSGCQHRLRKFFLVNDIMHKRDDRCPDKCVKGTLKLHSVSGLAPGVIQGRSLSCFCGPCTEGNYDNCMHKEYVKAWTAHTLSLPDTPATPTVNLEKKSNPSKMNPSKVEPVQSQTSPKTEAIQSRTGPKSNPSKVELVKSQSRPICRTHPKLNLYKVNAIQSRPMSNPSKVKHVQSQTSPKTKAIQSRTGPKSNRSKVKPVQSQAHRKSKLVKTKLS